MLDRLLGFIRFIADLPWWVGLAIFLIANSLIPLGIIGLGFGLFFTFLGMWIFSKLLLPDKNPTNLDAIIGLPLFILAMLVFSGSVQWSWLPKDFGILYGIRASLGVLLGLLGFNGFKK